MAKFPFSAAEWLTMFPAAPVPPPYALSRPRSSTISDPAASLRESDPLTAKALLKALNEASPGLRRMTQHQLAASWVAKYIIALGTVYLVLDVPAFAVGGLLLGGIVPTLQLAVGSVAVMYWLCSVWTVRLLSGWSRTQFHSFSTKDADLGGHPLALVARWLQLTTKNPQIEPETASELLSHNSADSLCPCPAKSCAGNVPRNAFRVRIVEVFIPGLALAAPFFLIFWGGLSAPTAFSTQWWGGAIFLVACLYHQWTVSVAAVARTTSNVASLDLSLRLHRRAVHICLSGLLERYETALSSAEVKTPGNDEMDERYLTLLPALATAWETRFPIPVSGGPVLFIYGANPVIVAIANIAAGGCVPLYSLLFLLYGFILVIQDLANFSAANAQITSVTRLVTDCRREIRLLLLRAAKHETSPGLAAWKEHLERHLTVLGSFENPDSYQAKFLGYPVNYGVLRTVLVTVFTIGVGHWTLLRGAGIRLSLLYACPASY